MWRKSICDAGLLNKDASYSYKPSLPHWSDKVHVTHRPDFDNSEAETLTWGRVKALAQKFPWDACGSISNHSLERSVTVCSGQIIIIKVTPIYPYHYFLQTMLPHIDIMKRTVNKALNIDLTLSFNNFKEINFSTIWWTFFFYKKDRKIFSFLSTFLKVSTIWLSTNRHGIVVAGCIP